MKILREIKSKRKIRNPETTYKYIKNYLKEFKNEDREYLIVLGLNTDLQILYREIVAIGVIDKCLVSFPNLFRRAVQTNCRGIIMAHNHPSGNLEPSLADQTTYDRLCKAGKILGIEVFDSLIIANNNDGYYSFENGESINRRI